MRIGWQQWSHFHRHQDITHHAGRQHAVDVLQESFFFDVLVRENKSDAFSLLSCDAVQTFQVFQQIGHVVRPATVATRLQTFSVYSETRKRARKLQTSLYFCWTKSENRSKCGSFWTGTVFTINFYIMIFLKFYFGCVLTTEISL